MSSTLAPPTSSTSSFAPSSPSPTATSTPTPATPTSDSCIISISTSLESCATTPGIVFFSGSVYHAVASRYRCRMYQRIDIRNFRKYTEPGVGLVSMRVDAILGAHDDVVSLVVEQQGSDGAPVATVSNAAAIAAHAGLHLNNSFSFNATKFTCVQRFSQDHVLVQPATAFIMVSFACNMFQDGHLCDGWGTNFSVSLQLARSISPSASPVDTSSSSPTVTSASSPTDSGTDQFSIERTYTATPPSSSSVSRTRTTLSCEDAASTSESSSHQQTSTAVITMSRSTSLTSPRLAPTMMLSGSVSASHSKGFWSHSATQTDETLRQSPSVTLPLPPSPPAYITVIMRGVTASVATTAALLSASSAGGALMQASLSTATCTEPMRNSGDARSSDNNPAMFLVSPFYTLGNNYAVVFGGIALVVGFIMMHLVSVIVLAARKRDASATTSIADVLTTCRFPNFSLHAALFAVQGVSYGGWALLWEVINPIIDEGAYDAGKVVAFFVSCAYPVTLLWLLWRIRVSLTRGDGLAMGAAIRAVQCLAAPTAAEAVADVHDPTYSDRLVAYPIPADMLPSHTILHQLAPSAFWGPRTLRLMFGVTFAALKGSATHVGAATGSQFADWAFLIASANTCFLPTIVSICSTMRPSEAARSVACNGVMLTAAVMMICYAALLAYIRPFRIGAKCLLCPLVILWIALTCVFSCPIVSDTVGAAEAEQVRGALSAMQSVTVMLLVVSDMCVLATTDRRMVAREAQDDEQEKGSMLEPFHSPTSAARHVMTSHDGSNCDDERTNDNQRASRFCLEPSQAECQEKYRLPTTSHNFFDDDILMTTFWPLGLPADQCDDVVRVEDVDVSLSNFLNQESQQTELELMYSLMERRDVE